MILAITIGLHFWRELDFY